MAACERGQGCARVTRGGAEDAGVCVEACCFRVGAWLVCRDALDRGNVPSCGRGAWWWAVWPWPCGALGRWREGVC